MEPLIAIYDACVLFPEFQRSFLIWLAVRGQERGVFRAKWTGRIHREWVRAVLRYRPDLHRSALRRTCQEMDRHVRGCRVSGYERWERRLTLSDPDDRHVLAAALACVADVIVTVNTTDFPAQILSPFGMAAQTPDAFGCALFARVPEVVLGAVRSHRAAMRRPPMSEEEYRAALSRNGLTQLVAFLDEYTI